MTTTTNFDPYTKYAVDAHYEWLHGMARPRRTREPKAAPVRRRLARALHLAG